MKDARRSRAVTLTGVVALALTVGVFSRRSSERRAAAASFVTVSAVEELRDAVASPMPTTAGLAGRPVPTSWFKTPENHRAEFDAALLASRRRRAARRAALLSAQ